MIPLSDQTASVSRSPTPALATSQEVPEITDPGVKTPSTGIEDTRAIVARLSVGYPAVSTVSRMIAVSTYVKPRTVKDAARVKDIENEEGLTKLLEDISHLKEAQISEADVQRTYLKQVLEPIKVPERPF